MTEADDTGTESEESADASEEATAETETDAEASTSGAETTETEELVARVAAEDESLAQEVADLAERAEALEDELAAKEAEIEELEERVKRTQADFKNYKQRAKKRQEQLEERATEDLVERLLEVRDNLSRALEEDADLESLREGVKLTRKEFDRVLDAEGVSEIAPDPGDEVDAQRHEVMMRVESDRPEGTIASVYRSGYEMGGKVLRTAQVTVSEGGEQGDTEDDDGAADAGRDGTAGDQTDERGGDAE